ncbi:uncharacterized protein LOC113367235 [Ctenocephalides felis]|uniref:uncharacterized protein LOC113367235 n=1 Tax=Ctenocephalides felis TaxID=7515 RepID=UPI000E6E1E03|nr:uncharacterized protein LOC113367235 [Ctenocephalides felis]
MRKRLLNKAFDEYNEALDQLIVQNLDKHIDDRDAMEIRYCKVLTAIENLIASYKQIDADTENAIDKIKTSAMVQLPQINLPNFNGEFSQWPEFRDMFSSLIINNQLLTNAQKLHYLKNSLNREAANLIRNVSITDANFLTAWNTLVNTYDNKLILINAQLKEIINQPQNRDNKSLRYFLCKSRQHVTAIKNEKIPVDLSDLIFIYILKSKLDLDTQIAWSSSTAETNIPSLDHFFSFLERRCAIHDINREQGPTPKVPIQRNHFAAPIKIKCQFCNKEHYLNRCEEILKLHVDDRIKFVKKIRLCFNCLNSSHGISQCSSKRNCSICKRRHNTILHKSELPRLSESNANNITMIAEEKTTETNVIEQPKKFWELEERFKKELELKNRLIENLLERNDRLDHDYKNLQKKFDVYTDFHSENHNKEITQLKNEYNKLREEIKEINIHLESKCQEKLLLQETITKLEKEIKGSHNANKDIMKLQQLLCETTADTRKQIKFLQKQMYSFRKSLYADQTVVKLKQKVFELNNRVAKLEEEEVLNTERNSKLVELEFLCHAQINSIALLESQKFDLIQNLHMARQQISSLKDKLALEHNVDTSSKVKLLNKKADDLLAEGCFIFYKCSSNNMKLENDRQAIREARKAAYRAWYNRKKEERKSRAEKQKKIKSELELKIKELFQRKIIQEVNYKSWLNRKKNNKIKVRMKHQINELRYLIIRQEQRKVYGPKFSLPPSKSNFNFIKILSKLENGILKLKDVEKESKFRSVCFLRDLNLCKRFLKDNPDIIVTRADKGNLTVVLNKEDYLSKTYNLLKYEVFYSELANDPTDHLNRQTQKLINNLIDKKQITKSLGYSLKVFHPNIPKLYCHPKVHKPDLPIRPIVSDINTPLSKLTKHISTILSKVTILSEFNVSNSFNLVKRLNNLQIPPDFSFIFGLPMGSSVSPPLADLTLQLL